MVLKTIIQNEYFKFFIILLSTLLVAKIFHFIMEKYLQKLTEKSKTDIDDIILKTITKPLFILVIFIGIYFSLKSLSIIIPYSIWLDNAFFVVLVLLSTFVVAKVLSVFVIRSLKAQKKFEKTPKLISKIISITVYLIAFLMILGYFKIEIAPLVATLGLGGLAVGLALQSTLSNFFAGLHIISDIHISVGDFIELPDVNISGYVEDIGWRSTRIRTLPNQIIIVPNSLKVSLSMILCQNRKLQP